MTPTATTRSKKPNETAEKPISQGRHEAHCKICTHPQRAEIEQAYVNWEDPDAMAKTYHISRFTIRRHARALPQLLDRRGRNLRSALAWIIEKGPRVKVNAAAVVSAIAAYARINNRGEWIERTETLNLSALFERMTTAELENYAKGGNLPAWFQTVLPATTNHDSGGSDGA